MSTARSSLRPSTAQVALATADGAAAISMTPQRRAAIRCEGGRVLRHARGLDGPLVHVERHELRLEPRLELAAVLVDDRPHGPVVAVGEAADRGAGNDAHAS